MLKLFKTQVYVKPLDLSENPLWGVFQMSPVESFFDDWFRYGWSVAWGNFQLEWMFCVEDW
jgi:hypothetical protein